MGARAMLFLVLMQIGFGALVAGLRAGKSYNTFPRMDGKWLPDGLYLLRPWWKNHLENILTVQFQHRMGALIVAIAVLTAAAIHRHNPALRRIMILLAATVTVQFVLGVATLLTVVDPWLASAHQLVAVLLFGLTVQWVYSTPFDLHQSA